MGNKFFKFSKIAALSCALLVASCAANNGGFNNPSYGANPYGAAPASPLGGLQNAVLGAIIQSMAGSVLNGQIGSQLTQPDQNFRLQQLGGMLQSGAVNQAQQWVNPQTGNRIALNPIGQQMFNQQSQQNCRRFEEVVSLQNGKTIREQRLACLNPQTHQWSLTQ